MLLIHYLWAQEHHNHEIVIISPASQVIEVPCHISDFLEHPFSERFDQVWSSTMAPEMVSVKLSPGHLGPKLLCLEAKKKLLNVAAFGGTFFISNIRSNLNSKF